MMFSKKDDSIDEKQSINQEKIDGDATASNVHIHYPQNVTINYGKVSNKLTTKKFEEGDLQSWEDEENTISIEDMNMIRGLIKKEEEVEEAIPVINSMRVVFELLPKSHKGSFITVIETIIKENKITKKLNEGSQEELSEELINLVEEMSDEERFSKVFSQEVYSEYKKIYNIIRSGDLESKVIPFIQNLIKKYKKDSQTIKEEFLTYWARRLENHPYAVFISNQRSDYLKFEIISKIGNKEKENIKVFARRPDKILLARSICQKIAKDMSLKLQEREYKIGYDKCITFEFLGA